MMQILVWLLVIEGLWLAGFPLAFLFLRRLPDRGFASSPALSLLLISYLIWLIASFAPVFNPLFSWLLTILFFAGLNGWLFWRRGGILRKQLRAYFRARGRVALLTQLVFLVGFFLIIGLRSYLPDIHGGEKFPDYSIYQSLLFSQTMPPDSLWFSGYKINYYYFGHFMMAYLTHLTGIEPAVVYNLFLATIFGVTGAGMFALGYNLLAVQRPKLKRFALIAGFLAVLFSMVLGNLDPVRQLAAPGERDKGFCNNVTVQENLCFWWTPARIIYDVRPIRNAAGEDEIVSSETINEFPYFSFMVADVHPHLIIFPFFILTLSIVFQLWVGPPMSGLTGNNFVTFGLLALLLGANYTINTWSYPVTLLIIAFAMAWKEWLGRGRWLRLGLYLVGLVIASLAVFAPFMLTFRSMSGLPTVPRAFDYPILREIGKNIGLVTWDRTLLRQHLLIFGIFDFCLISFLVLRLRPHFSANRAIRPNSKLNFMAFLPSRSRRLILLAGWSVLLVLGFVLHFETLGLLLVALTVTALLLLYEKRARPVAPAESFSLMLIGFSVLILLPIEIFYLRDFYENRGNSIGKYYIQVWFLVSLASAYGVIQVWKAAKKFKPGYRVMWSVALLTLICLGMLYPVLGSITRANLFAQYSGLNGENWLQRDYPEDYAAISWLKDQAARDPAFRAPILEATGEDYSNSARVSTFSGFPTLLAWINPHERQWRAGYPAQLAEIDHRSAIINNFLYGSASPEEAERILKSYNVRYVFVGALEHDLEKQGITQTQLNKFAKFMRLVYDKFNVQIYAF